MIKTVLVSTAMILLTLNVASIKKNIENGYKEIWTFIKLILDSIFLSYFIVRPNLGDNIQNMILLIGLFFIVYFPLSILRFDKDSKTKLIKEMSHNCDIEVNESVAKNLTIQVILGKILFSGVYFLFGYYILNG